MTTRRGFLLLTTAAFLAVGVMTGGSLLAGKGGGKPPKDDPPPPELPNVRYEITPISIPGTSYFFNNHNNAGAMCGWYTGGDAGTGKRAMAYLPWISTTKALDLNGPEVGAVGIPAGWHLRSAVDINVHGDIVGNIESDDPNNPQRMPIFLNMNTSPVVSKNPSAVQVCW